MLLICKGEGISKNNPKHATMVIGRCRHQVSSGSRIHAVRTYLQSPYIELWGFGFRFRTVKGDGHGSKPFSEYWAAQNQLLSARA